MFTKFFLALALVLAYAPAWAMQKHLGYATDNAGNVVSTASVRVKIAGSASDATIYSDDGVTEKLNPFDVESGDGSYYFYAANGAYDVTLTASGYTFDSDDTANVRLFDVSDAIIGLVEIIQSAAGVAQLKLTGDEQGYGTLRIGGSGSDDGDLYLLQTGSTVFYQSITDPNRLTFNIVPKGTFVGEGPATIELFGTDFLADGTNWERIRFSSKGSGDTAHQILSEKGGTGTIRSIAINAGSNHIWLDATTGSTGFGTTTVTGATVGQVVLAGIALASLGTPVDGALSYCSDCAYNSNPCTASSTGAFAKRINGAWRCD